MPSWPLHAVCNTHAHEAEGWPGRLTAHRSQLRPSLVTGLQVTTQFPSGEPTGRQCPYHHGDEGTHVALVHDEVAQAVQRRRLLRLSQPGAH